MNRSRIAIIDDDASLRAALSDLLRSMGYRISLFESADHFLRISDRRDFAGVISDVQMPGTDGFGLVRALHDAKDAMPVILITGRPDVQFTNEVASLGPVAFLRKPFDPATLCEHIERSFLWTH